MCLVVFPFVSFKFPGLTKHRFIIGLQLVQIVFGPVQMLSDHPLDQLPNPLEISFFVPLGSRFRRPLSLSTEIIMMIYSARHAAQMLFKPQVFLPLPYILGDLHACTLVAGCVMYWGWTDYNEFGLLLVGHGSTVASLATSPEKVLLEAGDYLLY